MIPERIFRKVLLPQPDGPTMAVNVPGGNETEVFSIRKREDWADLAITKDKPRVSIIEIKRNASKIPVHFK
jgi:hypothetical protein